MLKDIWRRELANQHLANVLSLRAQELRPGAELFLMMVAYPNEFVRPVTHDGGCRPSPLTEAMQQCIEEGTLRRKVLTDTVIPYYQREAQDIYDALDLMNGSAKIW